MTIQRQYSLPNCSLLLEGLSETTGSMQLDVRPVMSILVNAECRLAGYTGPAISGGREFFESLVTAVSGYAQEFLSGVPHQIVDDSDRSPLVEIRRIGQHLHRLIVQPQGHTGVISNDVTSKSAVMTKPIEVNLSTVQLFDLVEAVDQFFADTQTLPGLGLTLAPVEKRFAKSDETLVKQAAPAALGFSTLALAAITLFFVPIPEVQKPKEPLPQTNTDSLAPNPTLPAQTPTEPIPLPHSKSDTSGATVGGQTPSPVTSPSQEATETNSASPVAAQIPPITASSAAENVAPSTLPPTTTTPEAQTSTPLPVASPSLPPTTNTARAENSAPVASVPTIPPPTASTEVAISTSVPVTSSTSEQTNVQTASPLSPQTAPPTASTSKQQLAPTVAVTENGYEIVDKTTLTILNDQLHKQIRQSRTEINKYPKPLVFRVAMRPDGTVLNYEPRNDSARELVNQTPMPNLSPSGNSTESTTGSQEPVAYFKVVFTPKGVLQVSPWRGYR